MNQCPSVIASTPPPQLVPLMAASLVFSLLIPAIFVAALLGLLAFLIVKLVQSTERHRVTAMELAQARIQVVRLEADLNALRAAPPIQ